MSDKHIGPRDLGIDIQRYLDITKECTEEQDNEKSDPTHSKKGKIKKQIRKTVQNSILKQTWFLAACGFLALNLFVLGYSGMTQNQGLDSDAAKRERFQVFGSNYETVAVTDTLLEAVDNSTSPDDYRFLEALEDYEEIMGEDAIGEGMEAKDFHFLGNSMVIYQGE